MTEHRDLLNLTNARKVSFVRQSEASECGLACIAMLAGFHGLSIDLVTLRQRYEISLKGATLASLLSILDELSFDTRAVRAEIDELGNLSVPAILHWDLNHFVVYSGVRRTLTGLRYLIHDPAYGPRELTVEQMSASFTGVALEAVPSSRFTRTTERAALRVSQVWQTTKGLTSPLTQIVLLSLLLQIFTLASPFYMQIAIDSALPANDRDLLVVLALGFAGLSLFGLIVGALRDMIMLRLGSLLSFGLVNSLFRRLVRLPLGYFEKRHTGDILSRFDSTQPIADVISHGLVSAGIDVIMASTAIVLMILYAPALAALSVGAMLLLLAIRFIWFNALRLANISSIAARSGESSTLIETVRGVATIKLMNAEGDRQRLWANKRAQVINTGYKLGRLQTIFDLSSGSIIAIERIVFVFLAIRMAMNATLTIGMIFAFQAFKDNFTGATHRLINQWIQYRMLDVHLTRIADIVLSPPEIPEGLPSRSGDSPIEGHIQVLSLSFAYGHQEPLVLRDISFTVEAGETIAIVGPSGGGKTTLLKLLLGLYSPSAGAILIDGQPLAKLGLANFRNQVAAVLQEDSLYAGTIAENIAFFSPDLSMEDVRRAARLAAIDREIMTMPMGYDSLVGDMGSSLSGGQKQRVVLARALYRQPRILFLDEGTSHLDVETEALVNSAIASLGITRIIIAHRPETIRSAGRVLGIKEGRLVEFTKPMAA